MKIFPLLYLIIFALTSSASARSGWLNMPERAASPRELASAFDAGAGFNHSEALLQDGRRYVMVLWNNSYCGTNTDVCAYYNDGSSWVKLYQGSLPMWKGAPHIERRARVLDLAEGAVLLLAGDTCVVPMGGVPRVSFTPND